MQDQDLGVYGGGVVERGDEVAVPAREVVRVIDDIVPEPDADPPIPPTRVHQSPRAVDGFINRITCPVEEGGVHECERCFDDVELATSAEVEQAEWPAGAEAKSFSVGESKRGVDAEPRRLLKLRRTCDIVSQIMVADGRGRCADRFRESASLISEPSWIVRGVVAGVEPDFGSRIMNLLNKPLESG